MKNHSGAPWMRGHEVTPTTRGLVLAVVAWSLAWKAASLWRAAKNDSKPWFAALLLSNTMGLLDAVYLFGVDRQKRHDDRWEEELLIATGEPPQGGRLD